MADYTQGDIRPTLTDTDLATYQNNGSLVLDSRRTRPLWFDGRFLSARDLEREQNYFLQREADLGRAPGFGVLRGLMVSQSQISGQTAPDTITITAGQGVTPAGEQVSVPSPLTVRLSEIAEAQPIDIRFGIALERRLVPSSRTGLYAIALEPIEYTATPITAYPTTINGQRGTHDGDVVEATSLTLIPYPGAVNTNDATNIQASLARQIFLSGNTGQLPDNCLPLALVSLQKGVIQWLDPYMLRREAGISFSGVHFGLTDPATQQAFAMQYDSRLQQAVSSFVNQNLPARFAATDYFQALPPAGRFPLASINTDGFSQQFFPPQADVRLSIIPEDELAGLLEEGMSLPPIDLTLDPSLYANLTIFAMIPVPRAGFSSLSGKLPEVPMTSLLPQILSSRRPLDLLRFYQGATGIVKVPPAADNSWQAAIGTQTYGYYIRRRSAPTAVKFATPPPPPTTTTVAPTTTAAPTTVAPTTATAKPTTTTPKPTTTVAATTTTTAAPTTTTTKPPTTTTPAPTTVAPTTAPPTTTTAKPTTTPAPTTTVKQTTQVPLTTPILTIRPTTQIPLTTPILTIRPTTQIPLTTPILTIRPTTIRPLPTLTLRPITTVTPVRPVETIAPLPTIKPLT